MAKLKLQPEIAKDAFPRGRAEYRHWLSRRWAQGGQTALVIGINPNEATDTDDDGMTRFLSRLLRNLDGEYACSGYILVNCCDIRGREPKHLKNCDAPSSASNLKTIAKMLHGCDFVVASWGTTDYGPVVEERRGVLADLLRKSGKRVVCFSTGGLPIYCSQTTKNTSPSWSDAPIPWVGLTKALQRPAIALRLHSTRLVGRVVRRRTLMLKRQIPPLKQPSDERVKLWRYMDFTKFVSMLDHRGLYFSAAICLGDPFEGSYSKRNIKMRPAWYTGLPAGSHKNLSDINKKFREWTFVNCWHMNDAESAAMWKLYARTEEAVAIQTTYARLRDAMENTCPVGVVEYVNYETDVIPEGNTFFPFMHKRRSFAHEREVRALFQEPVRKKKGKRGRREIDWSQPSVPGIWRPVDLESLIDRIHVAPMAPKWFRDLMKSVTRRYGFSVQVNQSALDESPLY